MASASPPTSGEGTQKKGKKRIRSFTTEERAAHRVIEKQRREALNERFLDLARLVPQLAQAKRLSKSLIVLESISCLRTQRKNCLQAAIDIQALLAENLELVTELNNWRSRYGQPPKEASTATDSMVALMNMEKDTFGTFPGGFGDNAQIGPIIEKPAEEDDNAENGEKGDKETVESEPTPEIHTHTDNNTPQPQPDNRSGIKFAPIPHPEPPPNTTMSNTLTQQNINSQDFANVAAPPVPNFEALDEDLLLYMDNEFGSMIPADAPPPLGFPDMTMQQNGYNFGMQMPQNGFYMPPMVQNQNYNYHPGDSTQ